EQDIDGPQEQGLQSEEVAGQDWLTVVAQEGPPVATSTAGGGRWHAVGLEHGTDGRACDPVAQLVQLSPDAAVAPPPILRCQAQEEVPKVGADGRPARATWVVEGPFPAHQCAVPPEARLRLPEEQALPKPLPPVRGQPTEVGGQDGQPQPILAG